MKEIPIVERLEPCPFCGEGERLKIESCYVRCQSCCADGPVMDAMPEGAEEDETGAIWNKAIADLWNARAALSRAQVQG